jgi:putative ABC transport system ATP-binding protein
MNALNEIRTTTSAAEMAKKGDAVVATAPEPALALRGVTKTFQRGGAPVKVLDGVDLTVRQGAFEALMGPSGSGKSTLLNVIAGLERASAGQVTVLGFDLARLSGAQLARFRSRHIGFVFQAFNLIPVLTALENVALPLVLHGVPAKERRTRAATALDVVGLADRVHHLPRQLSGGQEQRVAIARAIVSDPAILLCDEPTGDLDRVAADATIELLETLNKRFGKTILVVTHDPAIAQRAGVRRRLDKGTLAEEPHAGSTSVSSTQSLA